ncbi:MAG: DmsE family decaheme c-type cytochrome [Thermoanaerobaculales bacterium]|nr:DmsE family decaheme c-type cytochrome [Thermoanaerobaculales bacterium]
MLKRSLMLASLAAVLLVLPVSAQDEMTCADCHDEEAAGMTNQIHMRIEPFEVFGRQVGCEGCHGDGTAHMEEGDAALIRTFENWTPDDVQACVDCHGSKGMGEWNASTHAMENISCGDCHGIHEATNPLKACKDCHSEVVAQFQLPSHHPLPERMMDCASCHDPHAATEAMVKSNHMRVNDLCYTCHQSQEGPFIFEHEPVQESCTLCHTPHGSVANNLLTANEPMLCLQCHEIHFHAGLFSPEEHEVEVGGYERGNPFGVDGMNRSFTTKCSTCHSQIHGTDLPSQSLASGGHGMVR